MGDMKEIRDAALAYYHNLSEEQKLIVYGFFQKMDTDGDGAITFKEFEQIFARFPGLDINRLFQDVDKNGDGSLDFEESVTLFYCILNERLVNCDGCNAFFIKGLYFTCVDCFDHNQTTTFDLCTSCYGSRNYVHHHSNFLDNYALLRTKAAYNNKSGSTNQPRTPNHQVSRSGSQTAIGVLKAVNTGVHVVNSSVDLVNNGVDVGSTVADIVSIASLCSIM